MSFTFEPLRIPDVIAVRPERHVDDRGCLVESYRSSAFSTAGIDATFVQENVTRSRRRVLRGLHYQVPPKAQGKLIGALKGRIFDVAVDLRVDGPTYGQWVGRTLDAESGELLWIPAGFAHGYLVLSDTADVAYKLTAEYAPELGRGIRWDDPSLGIAWPVPDPVLSPEDRDNPPFALLDSPFSTSESR